MSNKFNPFTGKLDLVGVPSANPTFSGTMNLASGTVISWGSGDVTITHSANALSFAGATSGYTFDFSISTTGISSTIQANIISAIREGSIVISSPYVADGFSPALYFRSTTDNPGLPKAAIFSETTGGGSYLFLGTSSSYASGITSLVSISPDSLITSGGMNLFGSRAFVSAVNNAYVYHTDALGLVMYGNGSTDDFTLAAANGANIMSVATGTTTARFFGAVNIGGTFTRRTISGVTSQLQEEGTDFDTASASLFTNSTTASTCPALFFARSRGSTVGSNTVVQSGDRLGLLLFAGTDGTLPVPGAIIQALVDGTPGASDMPGRLEFLTTPDGSSTPTLRLTINNAGTAIFTGKVVTVASTSSIASLNIPHGTAPTTPTDGDVWTTTAGLFIRINGVTKTVTLT